MPKRTATTLVFLFQLGAAASATVRIKSSKSKSFLLQTQSKKQGFNLVRHKVPPLTKVITFNWTKTQELEDKFHKFILRHQYSRNRDQRVVDARLLELDWGCSWSAKGFRNSWAGSPPGHRPTTLPSRPPPIFWAIRFSSNFRPPSASNCRFQLMNIVRRLNKFWVRSCATSCLSTGCTWALYSNVFDRKTFSLVPLCSTNALFVL